MSDYDGDVMVWSERQSALLRQRAMAERVDDRELGLGEPRPGDRERGAQTTRRGACFIVQALTQDLQAKAWPSSQAARSWRAEAVRLRHEAAKAFGPSMREHLDMAQLYAIAVRRLPETIGGRAPLPIPVTCPVTLEELLASEP